MMNILNGGKHADNNVDLQEFMCVPVGAATYTRGPAHERGGVPLAPKVLNGRGLSTSVGDEGGFAPELSSNEDAIKVILEAIEKAGYTAGGRRGHRARSGRLGVLRRRRRASTFSRARTARCRPWRWPPTTPTCAGAIRS